MAVNRMISSDVSVLELLNVSWGGDAFFEAFSDSEGAFDFFVGGFYPGYQVYEASLIARTKAVEDGTGFFVLFYYITNYPFTSTLS